jgi:hypothetical protein
MLKEGRAVIDPSSKRRLLHARVYEGVNPDGTKSQIVVRESAEFEYGDTLQVPITKVETDEATGLEVEKTEWGPVKLNKREHRNKTARGLAKQFGVSLDELLHRNGVYGQYQIQDPVMASLINPQSKPITGREDLVAMLQYAAENRVEKWVTLQVSNDTPISTVHAKVQFDGAGSPLLMGDYWARKLGKPNPRVSDLIDGTVLRGVDKAVIHSPRKKRMEIGHTVYATIDGKAVVGVLEDRIVEDGKRRGYQIRVLPGQGLDDDVPHVAQTIRAIPDTVDLDRPRIRRRFLKAPGRDVVLYADEVLTDTQGSIIPGSGKVKIGLPSNGLFGFEEMTRAPGVRIEDGDLVLDPSRLDAFREHVGGFVMDEHVQKKLDDELQNARIRETEANQHVVPMSDIVDASGGVNVNKLLKGCRKETSRGRFQLGSHQAALLQALADADGRIIGAHFMGTGKTVSAICGIKLMQNLSGKAKRVMVVVPKNTVGQWEQEVRAFTHGKATVIGAKGMAGSKQMWTLPENLRDGKPPGWTDAKYEAELERVRKKAQKANPNLWRPHQDDTDIVVVSEGYFTKHEAELLRLGKFDGLVGDEAQGIQRDNKRSQAFERWNSKMGFMMLLTGTPITNKTNTLPRYMKLISNGVVDWGSEVEFEKTRMVESAVLRANGSKSPSKMDINPNAMKQMLPDLKKYIHVATPQDVKGKVMPSVLMNENTPAAMGQLHSMMYRAYTKQLTPQDRQMLIAAANTGEDEARVLSDEGRRSVRVARNIANAIGYKPPDESEFMVYKSGEGKSRKDVVLKLPTWAEIARKYKGKFPSMKDVTTGKMPLPMYQAMSRAFEHGLGVEYESIAGRSILSNVTAKQARAMQRGEEFGNGISLGGKISNPEYGPEGAICRGEFRNGKIQPLEHIERDASGNVVSKTTVPVGYRFIRHPGRKSEGVYYDGGVPDSHPDSGKYDPDWDYRKKVVDSVESGTSGGDEKAAKGVEKGQKPKEGREGQDILRSPQRRQQRTMFDLVMTSGNAKSDALGEWIHGNLDPNIGGDPDAQHVIFAGAIGSGCRTVESKLRLMGYRDVNEALNDKYRAPEDRPPATGKYFVSYMGSAATLGDRDINSEIFKKAKDQMGKDTTTSLFVQRTMSGVDGGTLDEGKVKEGWGREQREVIGRLFSDMEIPARAAGVVKNGELVTQYAYDSELSAKDKREVKQLENKLGQVKNKDAVEAKINDIYKKYLTDRAPLTQHQQDVFNNCQFMVASDAAQVGMNWGNAMHLGMYDSLFSPMEEWQRITRVARMLNEAVPMKLVPTFEKLEQKIHKMGVESRFIEYKGTANSAMLIVRDAIKKLPKEHQDRLSKAKINPTQFAESFLAQRAIDRMLGMRSEVEQRLRAEGRVVTGAPQVKVGENEDGSPIMDYPRVKASEITSADVMNEIVEKHLEPFEQEILRSRKYLKDVKRFTASVEVPEMKTEIREVRTETASGKIKVKKYKEDVATGRTVVESPVQAEKAVLTRGRAKQVPVERLLAAIQNEIATETSFDFLPANASSLSKFGMDVKPPPTPKQVKLMEQRKKRVQKQRRKELEQRRALARKAAAARKRRK